MNIMTKILSGLLVLVCVTANAPAEITAVETSGDIQAMVEALNFDIAALDFLSAEIDNSAKTDQEVLIFRQDERSFPR